MTAPLNRKNILAYVKSVGAATIRSVARAFKAEHHIVSSRLCHMYDAGCLGRRKIPGTKTTEYFVADESGTPKKRRTSTEEIFELIKNSKDGLTVRDAVEKFQLPESTVFAHFYKLYVDERVDRKKISVRINGKLTPLFSYTVSTGKREKPPPKPEEPTIEDTSKLAADAFREATRQKFLRSSYQ